MFLFPAFSIIMLLGYAVIVQSISIDLNGGVMLGILLDFPIAVVILSSIFIRNTPLALFFTLSSVFLVAIFLTSPMYNAHAPIAYTFACILMSRIVSIVRKRSASDLIKDSKWLCQALNIPLIEWKWTRRANEAVNKSTKIFDVVTIILFILGALDSIETGVIIYSFLWLGYFTLYLSPILLLERLAKLAVSWQKNSGVNNLKDATKKNLKQNLDNSKKRLSNYHEETKLWIKSGFDKEDKE